jgi:hypothetical protein
MIDAEWKDLYLTPEEYLDLFNKIALDSEWAGSLNSNSAWHPEDLHVNMQSMFDVFGKSIAEYVQVVREKTVWRQRAEKHVGNPDRTKVDADLLNDFGAAE